MFKKRIVTVLILAIIGLPIVLHANEPTRSIKKSIVVVLDTSPSIEPYFSKLKSVMASALVDTRLEEDDYFSLIGFAGQPKILDGGLIKRELDKRARSEIWKNIKLEGKYTDLGSAMVAAIETQKELTANSQNQPLILFITDGEHVPTAESPFKNMTVDDFFKQAPINELELYNTWYFIGLGKDLKDIREIALKAGRQDSFISIDNPDFLEKLREWITLIPNPPPVPSVKFDAWTFGGTPLEAKSGKVPLLNLSANRDITFHILPKFDVGSATIIPSEFRVNFIGEDRRETGLPISLITPNKMMLKPNDTKTLTATANLPSSLKGKGTLSLEMKYSLNGVYYQMPEVIYTVNFVSSIEWFLHTWGLLIVAVFVVVLAFFIFLILRKRAPVKIIMEIVGNPKKSSTVSIKIGGKAEFGGRASLRFRLDGSWPAVIGQLARTGPDSWIIEVRERESFSEDFSGGVYRLGSLIRLLTEKGEQLSIRFVVKK